MILNNSATENAQFHITSANGRESSFDVNASTYQEVDLSEYQSPFTVQVTVGGSTTDMINGLDESQCVSVYSSGETYQLSATSGAA